MWSKYISRRLAVQVAQSWNFAWGQAMEKVYGISVKNILVFRDRRKTDYYVDKKQYDLYIKGLYRLLGDDKFIKSFHRQAQFKLENILKNTKKKLKQNLSKLSNAELLELYSDFILPNVEQFYIRMWTVFNVAEPLTAVLRENLSKSLGNNEKVDTYLLQASSPIKPNDVLRKKMDILKLALRRTGLNKKQFQAELEKLLEKYRHIPMFDFDHEPYKQSDFLKELEAIRNPRQELKNIEQSLIDNNLNFRRIMKDIKPSPRLRGLLGFLKENVFLRDYRDMIRQKLNLEFRKLYGEIAKRLGLNIEQVAVLTNEEIIDCLRNNKKFSKREAAKRGRAYLLIQKGKSVKIYSGQAARSKFNRELTAKNLSAGKEIRGVGASPGKAIGKVKIIYTNKNLNKLKRGDIMVATMTRQDFVSAMAKVRAIITDEGGIICHAAIIARELKIPCIVGTKIATQILRDGDRVEVDANKGIVKIIK